MNGLKSFLFFNDIGQLEVANYLGISKSYMSRIVSGDVKLRPEHLAKLVSNGNGWNTEFLTDPLWAALEAGEKLSSEVPAAVKKNIGKEAKMLPLIPIEAFAGPGLPTYEDERVEDYYTVSDFKESDFLIRVKGDSMTPKYCGGDLVACKVIPMDKTFFMQWGRAYVIYTDSQGVMIKRIEPSDHDGYIKCVSENPRYAPFDVPMKDVVSVALVNGSISLE